MKRYFLFTIFCFCFFLIGILFQRYGIYGLIINPLIENPSKRITQIISSRNEKVELLKFIIDNENLEKLDNTIDLAKKYGRGYRTHKNNPGYLDCEIHFDNKNYKSKFKLKGGVSSHYQNDENKISFKVKIKDSLILGMSKFSISSPRNRKFLNEWIFHELNRSQNVITPFYDFVEVKINGDNKGIYCIEEQFTKELLLENNRVPGIIFRFNPDFIWKENINCVITPDNKDIFQRSEIECYQEEKIINESENIYEELIMKVNKFRKGLIKTNQLFEVDKLAYFISVVDLLGSAHGLGLWNIRFYYNPVSKLIEPIGYDQNIISYKKSDSFGFQNPIFGSCYKTNSKADSLSFYHLVFSDSCFYKTYLRKVNLVSSKSFLEDFLSVKKSELDSKLNILRKDLNYSNYEFSKEIDILINNASYISQHINPSECVHAYISSYDLEDSIKIANYHIFPLEVVGLYDEMKNLVQEVDKLLLQPHQFGRPLEFRKMNIKVSSNNRLFIGYKVIGIDRIIFSEIKLIDKSKTLMPNANIDSLVFSVDSINKKILFGSGTFNITNDLVFDNNYKLVFNGDVEFNLKNNSSFHFTQNFKKHDSINILFISKPSSYSNVIIDNSDYNNFSFNNVNVKCKNTERTKLENCLFESSVSSPFLSVFNSKLEVINCTFYNNQKEAIKSSNSQIIIRNSLFNNVGYAVSLDHSSLISNENNFLNITDYAFNLKNHSYSCMSYDRYKNSKLLTTNTSISSLKNLQATNKPKNYINLLDSNSLILEDVDGSTSTMKIGLKNFISVDGNVISSL